jgi:hypothetical protein
MFGLSQSLCELLNDRHRKIGLGRNELLKGGDGYPQDCGVGQRRRGGRIDTLSPTAGSPKDLAGWNYPQNDFLTVISLAYDLDVTAEEDVNGIRRSAFQKDIGAALDTPNTALGVELRQCRIGESFKQRNAPKRFTVMGRSLWRIIRHSTLLYPNPAYFGFCFSRHAPGVFWGERAVATLIAVVLANTRGANQSHDT